MSESSEAVSVKPAAFYKQSPNVWFKKMESQFALANITKSETKYHHILASLPEDVAMNIDLDCEKKYEVLKEAVLASLKPNQHELIDQALRRVELGDKRPTQMVGEIRRRFSYIGLEVEEEIVKSQILTAMPHTIKSALVGHENLGVDEFSKIADSMLSVAASQTSSNPFLIGAIEGEDRYNNRPMQAEQYSRRPQHPQRYNQHEQPWGRDRMSERHDDHKASDKFTVRPFYSGQRPRVCNAHVFYGERARTCRQWCRWPNKPRRMLRDNEKTPAHSRSSSPVQSPTLNE